MNDNYRCPNCNALIPSSNQIIHNLSCPGLNLSNNQNGPKVNSNNNNINQNQRNNFQQINNNMNNSLTNVNNGNIIATNISSQSNPDGTRTEIKIETFQNGIQRITETKCDQFNNIIFTRQYFQNNNNNNFNNMNFININGNNNNLNNNNNNNIQRVSDQFGNVKEISNEVLSNGQLKTTTVTRDRNGNVIGATMNISGGNNFNNNNQMISMNNSNGANNNNNIMMMNTMMNNMNNMSMNMANMFSNMGMNMANMFNNMGMNMNMMFNNMGMNMNNMFNIMGNNMGMNMGNNMNNPFNNMGMNMGMNMNMNEDMNNGVAPDILNNLVATKIDDVSKLDNEKNNCIICLEDFKHGDEVINLPCLHIFHKTCLLEWFKQHDFCPICKFKLTHQNMNLQ